MPEDSTSSGEYEEKVDPIDDILAYQPFDAAEAASSPYVGMTYAHFQDRKISNKQNNIMALQRYFKSCACNVTLLQYDGDDDTHMLLLFDDIDRVREFVKSRSLGTPHDVQFFKPKQRVVRKVISMLAEECSLAMISTKAPHDESDSLQMSALSLNEGDTPSKNVDDVLAAGHCSGQSVTAEDKALVESRSIEIEFVSEDKGALKRREEVMGILSTALQSSVKLEPKFASTIGQGVQPHFFLIFKKNSEAIQVMSGLKRQERKIGVIFRRATTSNLVAKEVLHKCLADGGDTCLNLPKLSESSVLSPPPEAKPRPTMVSDADKPSRRVNTSGHVARRLVENSLGLRSTVSRDQIRAENRMVKDAAAAKRDAKNNRMDANQAFD